MATSDKVLSVVIATYNRGPALCRLLGDLGRQVDGSGAPLQNDIDVEVVVVDDGSLQPASEVLEAAGGFAAFGLDGRLVRQTNAGPGAARDHGLQLAKGEVIVIVDDDMRVDHDFLWQHLSMHRQGYDVVLGYIAPPGNVQALPVYERFHADQLERFAQGAADGRIMVRGVHLCTGNVSFTRTAYEAVGGFDKTLGHSEDRELGIRLEEHGYRLGFCHAAMTRHESDRASRRGWLDRSFKYGVYDYRIGALHPDLENADPWRFWFRINPVTRPVALAVVAVPQLGAPLAHLGLRAAEVLDEAGLTRPAMMATTFSYGMQYFRGLRAEAGGVRRAFSGLRSYWHKRRDEERARL